MTSLASGARTRLRRDRAGGWIAGVCAGIGRRTGVDPVLVRVAFVALTAAGGLGVALYALAWLVVPAGDAPEGAGRRSSGGRAAVEVAAGTGLLLLSVLLAFRELGLWFSDAIVWPLVLIVSGGVLIWRTSLAGGAPEASARPRAAVSEPPPDPAETARTAAAAVSRTGVGVALVIAAGFAFLQATGALGAARDVLLALIAAVVVLGVIFAPWIVRLVRTLASERSERIRSQERAEMAAHLHDSVLQTLAMVQRRAGEPREGAALARRQERELRAWLAGRPAPGQSAGLAAALEAAATEVEERHGVPVEVVAVGDVPLDSGADAVAAAAREAMTNAAKFGGGSAVDVFAELSARRLQVFVRDRGPGFDSARLPPDRRGVRESIVGRMRRHGGRATITSAPGSGTGVELVLEREGSPS
jgi:signal transduction histidine kinase/phage shock protein PspC (stress-responsive transcriptional regulator)